MIRERVLGFFKHASLKSYDKIATEFGLTVIDATLSIRRQQKIIRELLKNSFTICADTVPPKKGECVCRLKKNPYFGVGLPYIDPSDFKGKIIVIEGTTVSDVRHKSGTQEMDWMKGLSYQTGWTRSTAHGKSDLVSNVRHRRFLRWLLFSL